MQCYIYNDQFPVTSLVAFSMNYETNLSLDDKAKLIIYYS